MVLFLPSFCKDILNNIKTDKTESIYFMDEYDFILNELQRNKVPFKPEGGRPRAAFSRPCIRFAKGALFIYQ